MRAMKCGVPVVMMFLVMASTACALEEERALDDPALDDTAYGENEQALASWYLPFDVATTSGVTPAPPPVTEVTEGILGWAGDWVELPFAGWVQETVFRTSTLGGSKTGRADLWWGTLALPADGTYRLGTTDSPIRIRGFTKVKGRGNAFTDIDAWSQAYLHIYVTVGNTVAYHTSAMLGRDETKSESRTKNFDKTYYLPDGLMFSALAGQKVHLFVRMEAHVWANSDGAAELGIREFGIPAVTADNLVVVSE